MNDDLTPNKAVRQNLPIEVNRRFKLSGSWSCPGRRGEVPPFPILWKKHWMTKVILTEIEVLTTPGWVMMPG